MTASNAIEAAYGEDHHNLSPGRLKLYKISVNEEAMLRVRLGALGSGRLLQGSELVQSVFDDAPFFQTPRVVVEPGAATCNKRERSEDPMEANRRARLRLATLPIQTLSIIMAQLQGYPVKQEKHVHLPLVLAHRIFATFVSECETYEPSEEDLKFIVNMCQYMVGFLGDEKDQSLQFLARMREYGISLTEAKIEGTECTNDRDARISAYLISEARKEFGGSKDLHAAVYHLVATQSRPHAHPNDLRALPCIHIFYNGRCAFLLSRLSPSDPVCRTYCRIRGIHADRGEGRRARSGIRPPNVLSPNKCRLADPLCEDVRGV